MNEIAELVSLGLSVPTIYLSLLVVYFWATDAYKALNERQKSATQWFVIGIVVSFIGASADNTYWMIPWSLVYIESPFHEFFFYNGVFPNLIFRQGCGIIAAYCHLRSAFLVMNIEIKELNKHFLISTVLGVLYILSLTCLK